MRKTVPLQKGIKVGDKIYRKAVLRAPNAMDIIEAMQDSEVMVQVPVMDKHGEQQMEAQLLTSPTRVGLYVMLKQIEEIGEFKAPLEVSILSKLSPEDLNILQREAEALENASLAVAQRGRPETEGAADPESD